MGEGGAGAEAEASNGLVGGSEGDKLVGGLAEEKWKVEPLVAVTVGEVESILTKLTDDE